MKRRVLLLAVIVALIVGAAFFGGYRVGARPAASTSPANRVGDRVTVPHPAASAAYTLRDGDLVTVPGVVMGCSVERQDVQPNTIGGPTEPVFHCAMAMCPDCPGSRGPQKTPTGHWVDFLRNRIQVWKAGKDDQPVWSGKP